MTLFSDFLTALGVKHTAEYSDGAFRSMPFQSLFGLSKLFESYNIDGKGYMLEDNRKVTQFATPYLVQTRGGFIIVTNINDNQVDYLTEGVNETMSMDELTATMTGVVFCAYPKANAEEPDYDKHRVLQIAAKAKSRIIVIGLLLLTTYAFIDNQLYDNIGTICVILFDIIGLILSYMIVQKTVGVKSKTADAMCGVLEAGGCDDILSMKSSKFFGLFGWSEVGITYFSISLISILIFPDTITALGTINILCLPFTVWSIWYQRFRAHRWCTLCVSVQATLWCLFFSYLASGCLSAVFPLKLDIIVLGVAYVTTLMLINRIVTFINSIRNEKVD